MASSPKLIYGLALDQHKSILYLFYVGFGAFDKAIEVMTTK
jgi:hypothetical protein